MARRSRCSVMAAIVIGALVAGACSETNGTDAPAAVADATRGGLLTVGISRPTSIEPSNAADPSGNLVVRTMCDPLIQIDPVSGALKPAIAESWLISDGGRRFTVKLRKGVKFHNGQEVTSDDVVYSLSRVASEDAASPLATLLRQIEGYEKVHGDEKANDKRLRDKLSGIRVISKHGLEITLKEPNADFIRVLGHSLASPVPRATVEENSAFATQPVCAGPYALAGPWQAGDDVIRLRRFPGYRTVNEGYTGGGAGYAEDIEFRILADPPAEFTQFQAGALDVAHLSRENVAEARSLGDAFLQSPGPSLEYIGLPARTPPFDDRRVRVALSQALDRQALATVALGGSAVPAQGFLPPTLGAAHRPAACGQAAPVAADIDQARRDLAAAGVDLAGKKVKLYFNDEFGHRALVDEVGRQWQEAVGLTVEPVPMEWEPYLNRGVSASGFDGPFRLSLAAPYPSADAYLAPLFESSSIGRDNFSRFSNDEFDRVLRRVARRSSDLKDRRLDYQRLEDLACREMPIVPVGFATTNHVVNRTRLHSARGPFTDLATGEVLLRELFVSRQ